MIYLYFIAGTTNYCGENEALMNLEYCKFAKLFICNLQNWLNLVEMNIIKRLKWISLP